MVSRMRITLLGSDLTRTLIINQLWLTTPLKCRNQRPEAEVLQSQGVSLNPNASILIKISLFCPQNQVINALGLKFDRIFLQIRL